MYPILAIHDMLKELLTSKQANKYNKQAKQVLQNIENKNTTQ